jgi:hypothetical protein
MNQYFFPLVIGLALSFIAQPAVAYRTSGDSLGIARDAAPRWSNGTLKFDVYSEVPQNLVATDAFDAVVAAFQVWTSPDCASLIVDARAFTTEPPVHGDGRNTVGWVTDWQGDDSGGDTVGTTDITFGKRDDGTWEIIEADILLDANVEWTTNPNASGGSDVFSVVTHEVGHFLGLDHPCLLDENDAGSKCVDSDRASFLYPAYQIASEKLSNDDVAGVCFLYPFDAKSCAIPISVGMPVKCDNYCSENECPFVQKSSGSSAINSNCLFSHSCEDKCERTSDCKAGATCVANFCVNKGAEDGDPCRDDTECVSGACVDSFCASSCKPEDAGCTEPTDGARGFGVTCSKGVDCVSRLCLEVNPGQDMCTRECNLNVNNCPLESACKKVGDFNVCVPDNPGRDGSCGCRFAGSRHLGSYLLLVMAVGLIFRRFEKARASVKDFTK